MATPFNMQHQLFHHLNEVEEVTDVPSSSTEGVEFNRVDYIVSVLHESARSFSKSVESLGVSRCGPELSMAWIGKDVHEWHRRIAYQVAVYALMKTAIDLEILLSHERHNEFSPVREILNPLTNQVGEHIELQLRMQHPDLVHWFRDTEMPQIAAYFIPLLKQWSVEYAGSGIAGIIVAITCCTAVVKLGRGRIRRPIPVLCFEDVLVKLMDFSLSLASVDKLHQLATEAGFELNFLLHFGKKILPSEKTEELEFWIGLAHKKLQKAFSEESIMSNKKSEHKIPSDTLAILGLFAYLGRRTRIFLSAMGIKDLDEIVKDLLSYLECGILSIYPDFSCIPVYQCFMEVVTDEIGWLDFYASYVQINCKQKRKKHNARQAEKEIILSVVFTVCYDVFSGFAHFNRSTQQSLDTASLSYLLHCDSLNIMDHAASDNHTSSYIGGINGTKLTLLFEGQHRSQDLTTKGFPKIDSHNSSGFPKAPISATNKESSFGQVSVNDKSSPLHQSVIKRYSTKLALTSADLWMGTRLLFMDIKVALQLLAKQAHGFKPSRSQRKRLERTLTDVIVLIPMTILMLLPVTTVGHAAIIAAIKKYMPFLIPSSYSPERLDVVKQLKQTREMMSKSNQSLENQDDQPPTIS
ncbi:LETM1 domain-containing protein [Arachis hypogaea]|nr:LETM1 domain-containing protein [Arachis hypogaea]